MQHARRTSCGFTLIEVLVVLVIVAIITAVAVLAFGTFGASRSEKIKIETFTRMIAIAQSQAILTPTVLGLNISSQGYFYSQQVTKKTGTVWRPMSDTVLYQPSVFKGLLNVKVTMIGNYNDSATDDTSPRIVFLPSGYVTPFTVDLKSKTKLFTVTVSNNGAVSMKEVGV
jgi:general secretion pathway protein H